MRQFGVAILTVDVTGWAKPPLTRLSHISLCLSLPSLVGLRLVVRCWCSWLRAWRLPFTSTKHSIAPATRASAFAALQYEVRLGDGLPFLPKKWRNKLAGRCPAFFMRNDLAKALPLYPTFGYWPV
jgi:hypothetical protein